jgi:ubiquinone/menaquinone biosynthesis C-methylase UbiE
MAKNEPPGTVTGSTAESDYQLGHDHAELERLSRQGRMLAPATRIILDEAGLLPGMRVLDLGSGMGDLAFVAAELIGPTGQVVGVDRSPDTVAQANIRARRRGLGHVRFVVGDIHDLGPAGPFDAIIGRLVLMYVSDPAAVLRTQAALLGPGGLVIPIEFDVHTVLSAPPLFPSRTFTEFPTGLRLLFYSTAPPFARSPRPSNSLS